MALKTANHSFRSSSWWCITTQSLVIKGSVAQMIGPNKHSLTFWSFTVTLTLNTAIQFYSHDTPICENIPSNHDWLQKNQQFRRYSRNIQIISALAVALPLRQQTIFFHMTLWLMIIHHHTQFGYKRMNSWMEISRRQTFADISNLCFGLGLEHSNRVFHRTLQLTMMYHQHKFGCKQIKITYTSRHCDLAHEDKRTIFLPDTLTHDKTPP